MINYNLNELKKKSDKIIKQGWFECKSSNKGEVGLLFERLLGLSNHNLYIPDYKNIEIYLKLKEFISAMVTQIQHIKI